MSKKFLIFTDLDGTLLDKETYSPAAAMDAVQQAKRQGVPIIFCSSKTRAEQLVHREELGINDPFIVEDGGAIYLEPGYFTADDESQAVTDDLRAITLGTSYDRIEKALEVIRRETNLELKGYSDLTVDQVAEVTGLNHDAAARAKQREFEETIVSPLSEADAELLRQELAKHNLRLSRGGRFFAVLGNHDKGMAVKKLVALFEKQYGPVTSVGLGDSSNDLPMLSAVDQPVLVQKTDESWEDCDLPDLRKVDAIGPGGWSKFVSELLAK